jgi:hypothetical protein
MVHEPWAAMHARLLTRTGSSCHSLRFMVVVMGSALVLSLSGADRAHGAGLAAGSTTSPPTVNRSSTSAITSVTAATPSADRQAAGTWQRLPAPPMQASPYTPFALWTGKEILLIKLVVAGMGKPEQRITAEGAAYNPATRSWRKLPVLRSLETDAGERDIRVVWTGSEALVAGVVHGAYNPATNRWRRIATPTNDHAGSAAFSVWTGRQLLVWGGGCCSNNSADGAAYTLETDTWRELPPSPLPARQETDAVWTGKELIIVGGQEAEGRAFADAAAYNPTTRSWRRLPPMPAPRSDATVTWTGKEILVVGGRVGGQSTPCACGVAFDPAANRWRSLPAMEVGRARHAAAWTGRLLLVWGGETGRPPFVVAPPRGVVFDPVRNRWSPMPKSPLSGRTSPAVVWTGNRLIVWGGWAVRDYGKPLNDGPAAYTP